MIKSHNDTVVNDNWIPFSEPKNMKLLKATVSFTVADEPNDDASVSITVTSDKFAL